MARLINALQPWRERIVLIGGWAHRLYRRHGDARAPGYQAVVTRDADLALDDETSIKGDIAKGLEAAGFEKRLSGDHDPPVSHFQLGGEDAGFYAEFLTPLRGGGVRRDGSDDATVAVAGVTAQKLRHLEVLLVAPWRFPFTPSEEFPVVATAEILVANPVSFIAQKLLIHESRLDRKQAQDVLYLHDTIELFESHLVQLQELWQKTVGPSLGTKQRRTVMAQASTLFKSVSDTVREAARIPVDRTIDPSEIRLRCELGLSQLFAGPPSSLEP
ncbi:MAG: nucleotidyltransferase domain-containing protein [Gemmatimonadaceae bacterium]|nr:nucleotidyltransferase domain-containing protein [Gemmatimonadaceae bacterium]